MKICCEVYCENFLTIDLTISHINNLPCSNRMSTFGQKLINLYHSMKKYLKFGVLSFVVLVSIFFCRKAEHNELQNVILLNNVEALAAGENPTTKCIGTGSVDCPLNHEKVKYVFEPFILEW